MKKGQIILTIIFILPFFLVAQNIQREYYIDIPSAKLSRGLYLNLDGNYPIGAEEAEFDINAGLEFSTNNYNLALKWLNGADFSLDVSYLITEESGNIPALSLGINNITYRKFISPLGHDSAEIFSDEMYRDRAPEIASAYLVATKEFGDYFEVTTGFGRGRFIGYGPRSKLLNFDVFFEEDERHEEFIIGMFGGMKLKIPDGPAFILETDGRDANFGIQYEKGIFKGTIALTKMELFTSDDAQRKPRISTAFSLEGFSFDEEKPGYVNIKLTDYDTGEPISGTLIYKNGREKTVSIPVTGKKFITIEPGIYQFMINSPDYKMKQAKIPINSGQELNLNIKMKKKVTPNMVSSLELTKEGAQLYKDGKFLEAREKLRTALNLYPDNEKAGKGLEIVEEAIQDTISTLKTVARNMESRSLTRAIELWEQVLNWGSDSEVENHIQELRSRVAAATNERQRRTSTPSTERSTRSTSSTEKLSDAEISELYKKGIKAYINGNYSQATEFFSRILESNPNHKKAQIYLKKAKEKL